MVDNDLVGLLGIYAMRDIGRYMKTATRKMIKLFLFIKANLSYSYLKSIIISNIL